jgi:hypothetical protein
MGGILTALIFLGTDETFLEFGLERASELRLGGTQYPIAYFAAYLFAFPFGNRPGTKVNRHCLPSPSIIPN